jgi:hypothetical protein
MEFTKESLKQASDLLFAGNDFLKRANEAYLDIVKLYCLTLKMDFSAKGGLTDFVTLAAREAVPGIWPTDSAGSFVGVSNGRKIAKSDLEKAEAMPKSAARTKAIKKALEALELVNKVQSFASWKAQFATLEDCLSGKKKVAEKAPVTPVAPVDPDSSTTPEEAAKHKEEVKAEKKAEVTTSQAFSVQKFLAENLDTFIMFLSAEADSKGNPELEVAASILREVYRPVPAKQVVNG